MRLSERFSNLELLGQGMTSKVYQAVDSVTQSPVAIKIINPNIAQSTVGLERFKREIQITRQISHPLVIQIFDFHESKDEIFLVMELLRGSNLADHLKAHGPISIETAEAFLRQLLDVLDACHRANVVHRDLKPQNIFVLADQSLKLLDFGISRMATLSDLTQTGTTLGTPEYMAPELFETSSYDPRSDLYAIGVIMHELLTGRPPFEGETLAVLFRQHAEKKADAISKFRQDVPTWMSAIIEKLLEKRPIARYQSAKEALFDLQSRTVIARSLPQLGRRTCLSCNHETLSEFPVCLHCGFTGAGQSQGEVQTFELWINRNFSKSNVDAFLKKHFAMDPPVLAPRRKHLLASHADLSTAKIIRQQARTAGVGLEVRPQPTYRFRRLTKWVIWPAAILASIVVGFVSLTAFPYSAHASAFRLFFVNISTWLYTLGGWVLAPLVLGAALTPPVRKSLLSQRDYVQHRWFSQISSLFTKSAPQDLSESNINLIEKFMVIKQSPQFSEDHRATLETALTAACKISSLMADIHGQMKSLLENTGRGAVPDAYLKLEEAYSRLNNKLVFINSQFNSIVGRALSERAPVHTDQLEDLNRLLEDSTREARFWLEAEREIKEAA